MSKVTPQRFGKYILLRRIALGGMAEIFKAKSAGAEGFEKVLVIKRILPHFSDDEAFVRMFVDEARLTAKLQHPNIVQIFDFDVVDGSYYIAMEYIEGKDLKEITEESLKQGDPLSVAQGVFIAAEIAKGLHYAHTKEEKGQPLGIVHRDVTPSNVMISYRGDVKLMDFGIAKAAQRSTKTQAGAVKGKVAYMSPEQARGKPLDGRSDIFALGVMLWEMLTGKRLFVADSDFETIEHVLRLEAPAPSSINPRCPSELDPIVLKCIAKDPNDRYASAEILARDLTRWYYSTVTDLEREKLKPLMYRVFKKDIDQLEQNTYEEDTVLAGGLPPIAGPTSMQPASRTGSGPVSEDSTRMDFGAADKTRAAGSLLSDVTLTRPRGTATNAASLATPIEPQRRGSPLPWILLVILLLGGGFAAVWFLVIAKPDSVTPSVATTSQGGTVATPGPDITAPDKGKATLYIKVDPHTATVTVDGKEAGGEVKGLEVGQKVRVVAEAKGYKRFEDIVAIEDSAPVFAIKMEKEGVARRIVIKPSAETDEVFVDDQRLGLGTQPFSGMVGQEVLVKVVPATGAAAVTKLVKITEDASTFEIATPGALIVTIEPPDAKVTASSGTIEVVKPGVVAIRGVEYGKTVTIEVKAKDFKDTVRDVIVSQPNQAVAVKLDKSTPDKPSNPDRPDKPSNPDRPDKPTNPDRPDKPSNPDRPDKPEIPVGAKGSILVTAKPWAQVSVNGRPYGSVPVTVKELSEGTYTVVLMKGSQSVTKTVSVKAGKQASVYVDFTEL